MTLVALAAFVGIGAAVVAAPVVAYLACGARAEDELRRAREWLTINHATVVAVLLLVIGAKLVGDTIGILDR